MAKYRADLYGLKLRGGATRASHSAFKGRASVQSPVQCSQFVDDKQLVKNWWRRSVFLLIIYWGGDIHRCRLFCSELFFGRAIELISLVF